jgi:hypothetical protein
MTTKLLDKLVPQRNYVLSTTTERYYGTFIDLFPMADGSFYVRMFPCRRDDSLLQDSNFFLAICCNSIQFIDSIAEDCLPAHVPLELRFLIEKFL